jgi:hypothetical protein
MAATDTTTGPAKKPDSPAGPGYWKVRESTPVANKRTIFRSMSEARARTFLERRCPAGEVLYLESPTGATESYVTSRQDENGQEVPSWQPFVPEDYVPPGEALPPGTAGWPDMEG